MKWFGFLNKVDGNIKPFFNIASRRKIPVIVCTRGDMKTVGNKILRVGGRVKYEYNIVKAFACELTSSSIDRLSEVPEVSYILFDYKATLCMKKTHDTLGIENARKFHLTGKNIGIGFIDTGFFPHNEILGERRFPIFFEDLINGYKRPYDDNGHGTFSLGCAIGKWEAGGIAPDSDVCMIKAFDISGKGYMSDIIKGIEIIYDLKDRYNIKIICLPFEFPYVMSIKINPLEEAIKVCIKNNISVIAPAGNYGPQASSIYFPGNIQEVITVGAAGYSIERYGEIRIAQFSGRGPDKKGGVKPDFIVPGENITSLNTDATYIPIKRVVPEVKIKYTVMSGTSISCSITAGFAALIYEKSPILNPKDLKSIMLLSCISIAENKFSQGKGILAFEKVLK